MFYKLPLNLINCCSDVIMKEDEQLNYTSKQCLKYEYKNKKNVKVCLAMKSKK